MVYFFQAGVLFSSENANICNKYTIPMRKTPSTPTKPETTPTKTASTPNNDKQHLGQLKVKLLLKHTRIALSQQTNDVIVTIDLISQRAVGSIS